jgi:hypothetical protein
MQPRTPGTGTDESESESERMAVRSTSVCIVNGVVRVNGRVVRHHAARRSVLSVLSRWWRYRARTRKGGGWELTIAFRRT